MATTPADKARQLAQEAANVVEKQRAAEQALVSQLRGERYLTNEEAWYLLDLIADLRRATLAAGAKAALRKLAAAFRSRRATTGCPHCGRTDQHMHAGEMGA